MVAPISNGEVGYIFDLMCPGGEVKGKVYNKMSKVFILNNGKASSHYKEVCKVHILH